MLGKVAKHLNHGQTDTQSLNTAIDCRYKVQKTKNKQISMKIIVLMLNMMIMLLLMMVILVMRMIMRMRMNMKVIKMKKMAEMLKWLLQAAPSPPVWSVLLQWGFIGLH